MKHVSILFLLLTITTISYSKDDESKATKPSEEQPEAITKKLIFTTQEVLQKSTPNLEKITGEHKTVIEALQKNQKDILSKFSTHLIFQSANLIYEPLSMAIKIQEPAISLHTLIKCEDEIPDNLLAQVTTILENPNLSRPLPNSSSKETKKVRVNILPLIPHIRVGKANYKCRDSVFDPINVTSRRKQQRHVITFVDDLKEEITPLYKTEDPELAFFPPKIHKTFPRIQ